MKAFIDDHRSAYEVEPTCRVLPAKSPSDWREVAPSTYHGHAAGRADPKPGTARERRDAELCRGIRRVFAESFGVCGVRKVWRQMRREGLDVARCTVSRLMRRMGLKGVVRGKSVRTTISDTSSATPNVWRRRH